MPFIEELDIDRLAVAPKSGATQSDYQSLTWDSSESAQTSITAIWRTEYDRLWRMVKGITRSVEDADDVLANTWVKLAQAWDRINDTHHATKLIWTVARLLAIDVVRRRKQVVEVDTIDFEHSSNPVRDLVWQTCDWVLSQCDKTEKRYVKAYWKYLVNPDAELTPNEAAARDCKVAPNAIRMAFMRLRMRLGAYRLQRGPMSISGATGHGYERQTAFWSLLGLTGEVEMDRPKGAFVTRWVLDPMHSKLGSNDRYVAVSQFIPALPVGRG